MISFTLSIGHLPVTIYRWHGYNKISLILWGIDSSIYKGGMVYHLCRSLSDIIFLLSDMIFLMSDIIFLMSDIIFLMLMCELGGQY